MTTSSALFAVLLLAGAAAPAPHGEQARELERLLIAPCCWRQPVADHFSAEADQLRGEIRALLQEGKTQEEILDFYVARYGKAILAKPPYQGLDLLAYVLPGCFLLLLGGGLGWIAVKSRRRPAAAPPPDTPLPDAYAARLERELKELEE
jgi:cytochrome c-type biogenesis protein CcmH